MKNFRDIEQLSSYLDGQLSPSESTRLESRIASDPELASAYNDIRAARSILRKLPSRKAPRNFTLTRQMVGLKPPLPRSYSFFRFSTAFATVLLMCTFATNLIAPNISLGASAPAPVAQESYSVGGGPAATEAPMAAAAPALEMVIAPTGTLPAVSADSARIIETPMAEAPMAKELGNASEAQDQPQGNAGRESIVPVAWQIGLLAVGLISLLIMLALRQSAIQKWK
jgi:anti-sigma factor RsiW